ncbi:hypothetical protein [Ideonella sp. A 288]|uniref:hypothetical protein n=1 Tax=Ideonella sp. A 288 TaxID=1962181 RepID=UPI000B4A9DAD|nr:hypothetical protein [Ideonella sp. A 288]
MRRFIATLLLSATALLGAGCDQLGIESASAVAARKEADGKAVGGACRHAGRAIEDCYTLNKKADRPSVYAGWREMNEYMRENKIEPVIPVIKPEQAVAAKPADEAEADDAHAKPAAEKPAAKGKKQAS